MNSKVYYLIGALVLLIIGVVSYRFVVNLNNTSQPTPSPTIENSTIPSPSPQVEVKGFTYDLKPQGVSTQSGMVKLEEMGAKTKVTIELKGALAGSRGPAHIHKGSCTKLGAIAYSLETVVDGRSETIVEASMSGLLAQLPLAVNVHKSAAEIKTYVACGDIQAR